jgi:peptidoglycan-associated lipoprotein
VFILIFTTGCSTLPRKHWWQFWRPKATAAAYNPDLTVLPPAPDSLDGRGGKSLTDGGELPPPPAVGSQTEPDPLRRAASGQSSELRPVHFDYDSATISAENMRILDGNAQWLIAHPKYQIQIEGHTDERGTDEYNLNLGDQRAKAVKGYLISKGVPGESLHTISYGEERPLDPSQSETAWSQNRRAQFLVY